MGCQPAEAPTNSANSTSNTAATETADTAKKAAPTDLAALSNRLVTQVAGVKKGESVFINGSVRDLELENLKTDVRKAERFHY